MGDDEPHPFFPLLTSSPQDNPGRFLWLIVQTSPILARILLAYLCASALSPGSHRRMTFASKANPKQATFPGEADLGTWQRALEDDGWPPPPGCAAQHK